MTKHASHEGREWQDIASAPKDGTHLLLRNPCMDKAVIGKFGKYVSSLTGKTSKQWIVVKDCFENFMPIRSGTLMCPTEWMSLSQATASGLMARKGEKA